MGQKMMQYFADVEKFAGMQGRRRLAMKTCISSITAKNAPDTPEQLAKLNKAVQEIRAGI